MTVDPDELRATSRESWENAAAGWESNAQRIRDWGMPVSAAMLDAVALQPGQRVLELAAGAGDTGFMAAELISPGGLLICSDGAEAMVDVARRRAQELGITNVEFRQLELEWIDLPTADVDAVLCRWGIMLIVDPAAAAREIRRVLRPGGSAALAVWDVADRNPWAMVPQRVLLSLGLIEPPDPEAPGMFVLGADGRLASVLDDAGFAEVEVHTVPIVRRHSSADEFVDITIEMSPSFRAAFAKLGDDERADVRARVIESVAPYASPDGAVSVPGSALVGVGSA